MTYNNKNTGDCNTGDCNTGDCNAGDRNTGDRNTGHYNTGDRNTGHRNTGDYNADDRNTGHYNTGDRNTGDCNTGGCNTGDYNAGHRNTGHRNTGDCNAGHRNTGNHNTGNRNAGDYNTGDCNTGHYNTGFFNTSTPKVTIFNKESNLDFDSHLIRSLRSVIWNNIKPICIWVYEEDMTDEEKEEYPTYKITGGYLKERDYKYCWQKGWKIMSEEDKEFIKSLPNFCPKIFEEITGINVNVDSKRKVTLELTDEQLDKINDILKNDK